MGKNYILPIQRFTICENCSGLNTINSRSDRRDNIFAITIPRDACGDCIDKGYELYNTSSKGIFTNLYLQDRVNDEYLVIN